MAYYAMQPKRRQRRRLGSASDYLWWLVPGGSLIQGALTSAQQAQAEGLTEGLPGGVQLQNLTSGTLTPGQVAILQSQGVAQVQQVQDNTNRYYGPDSAAAQAIASILPAQIAGVESDIATLNPQNGDALLAATGIPWYWWAAGAGAVLLALR